MNAVRVLTLVCPNDLEGHFAEVDAIENVGLMVGARSMIGQQQSLYKSHGHGHVSGIAPSSSLSLRSTLAGTSDDIPRSLFASPGKSNQFIHPA